MIGVNFQRRTFYIAFALILIIINVRTYAQDTKYEAEDAQKSGTTVATSHKGFSGTGYVTGFDNDGDKVTFTFNIEKEGNYQLYIGFSTPNGTKNNIVYINGSNQGSIQFSATNSFTEINIGKIWFTKGENTIVVEKEWGWFELDYIRIDAPIAPVGWTIPKTLVNPNASTEAKNLYSFLLENFGKTTFSGQFMNEDISYTSSSSELSFVQDISGKYPAIYGTDLIDYSPSRTSRGSNSIATEDAIKWAKDEKGIVTLMWHWNAPTDLIDSGDQLWWRGFYTEATTFDISEVLKDPNSSRYELILRDIDTIAYQLKKFQEEKIPVLWRPLHEAEGKWFWWGAKGSEACKQLWILLYDRLTNYHGLDNLIWVWTTTDNDKALDWYPGDNYVDILGVDVYNPEGEYGTSSFMFDKLRRIFNGKKMLTMSENGPIPDPQQMFEQEATWLYFCTWVGSHINDGKFNTKDHIDEVFNHSNVTTLDELQQLWKTHNSIKTLRGNKSNIRIYPVPFENQLKMYFPESEIPDNISVMDISGRVLKDIPKNLISMNTSIAFENNPAGIYLICIRNEEGTQFYKVMKN